jgi:hypothetical protein
MSSETGEKSARTSALEMKVRQGPGGLDGSKPKPCHQARMTRDAKQGPKAPFRKMRPMVGQGPHDLPPLLAVAAKFAFGLG